MRGIIGIKGIGVFFYSIGQAICKKCNRRDHIKNENIRSDLDFFALNERIKEYRRKWIQHIDRMEESRILKLSLIHI